MSSPRDFRNYPWDGVTQNSEDETVARNIMIVLTRNGNVWRELSWEEYVTERMNDGDFSSGEEKCFRNVIHYTTSEEMARKFSPKWRQ